MTIGNVLMLLGGLGLLLYGMKMMSSGLTTIAGDSMQAFLRRATSNRFTAVLVGTIATIVINSSTATTIITVSFVNSGILSLFQSIGIIMGANVGTTFSTQLIAFGMGALRLDNIAMTLIFIGSVLYVFPKNARLKNIGNVVLGFGVLFFGITIMSDAMRPLRGSEAFQEFLIGFENPVLALLAGFVITAIIQSSTATTAILVTLLATGMYIPFQTVAFILLGVNIGTSLTTVIASIPASRESKRAAFFHIMYDIIGSVIFGSLILFFPGILDWFTRTWHGNYAQQAAMFHTIYNVSTMLLLLPFVGKIAQLMQKIVPVIAEKSSPDHEKKLVFLDTQISQTPSVNVLNAHMEVCRMGQIASENFNMAVDSFYDKDDKNVKKIKENEKVIDFLNHKITAKLAEVNRMTLSPQDAINVSKMFVILSDIERIGDHAINIAEHTNIIITEGRHFSKTALAELKNLTEATSLLITRSMDIFNKKDKESLAAVKAAEKKIDKNTKKYTNNHIERLKNGECEPSSGVIFTAIINDLERCADHAKNIAFSVSLEKKWDR